MATTTTNASGIEVALSDFTCGHIGSAFFPIDATHRPCGGCKEDARRFAGEGGHPEVAFN